MAMEEIVGRFSMEHDTTDDGYASTTWDSRVREVIRKY